LPKSRESGRAVPCRAVPLVIGERRCGCVFVRTWSTTARNVGGGRCRVHDVVLDEAIVATIDGLLDGLTIS
jgi:hypothetical protein